jgi:glycosyltransferase involved in cell wall biosynthesis
MSCSIVIPTFHRKKFEKLIEMNIRSQTYPNILEVVIADDGTDETQTLTLTIPYPIVYVKCPRMSIGEKRNVLAKTAKGEYIAHMDTDDIYFPQYIDYSIHLMQEKKKNATGTSDMLFLFKDGHSGAMRNLLLSMANEATLVYKKSFWERTPFGKHQTNEGISFLRGRHWEIAHSSIQNVMICLCHEENTVDKSVWKNPNLKIKLPSYTLYEPLLQELGFVLETSVDAIKE